MAATNSNELLKFMNTATSNIQEALGRSSKNKKVNHRKYLEKRLQRGPRTTKKPRPTHTTTTTICNRQPVAGLLQASLPTITSQKFVPNEYDQLYQIVSQPSLFPATTTADSFSCSRPPSVLEEACDPEIESLLSEFGVDSPSQCSLYGDSCSGGSSSRGSFVSSMCSSASLSLENTVLTTTNDCYPSDFSDFDESNHPSPRNPSPLFYPNISPSPPDMYYHHSLTASYDCIPTTSTLAVTSERPSGLSLPYNPSITELIAEFVSTP